MDKWKIVKPRPHYLRTTTRGQTQTPEESDSDDDFDLPKVAPLTPTPPPKMQQCKTDKNHPSSWTGHPHHTGLPGRDVKWPRDPGE